MNILSIDEGYGDVKIAYGNESEVTKLFKFPSVLCRTSKNPMIQDNRIYEYKGNFYYIGEDALVLESSKIIDIATYDKLEYFAPLFLHYAIKLIGETPDIIVTGLSKAQIQNSKYFEDALKEFTVDDTVHKYNQIYILPQGAGSKLAIDKYDDNFPTPNKLFTSNKSYIAIDIGFNTLDLFQVLNGKTSSNLFEGIENQGIIKLAYKVRERIKTDFGKDLSLKECKQILDTNEYKLRGKASDFTVFNEKIKMEYLSELNQLAEEKYGKILDKMDYFYLLGGGSYIFANMRDKYYKVPHKSNEFYNALGFYLYGVNKSRSI